MDMTKEVLAKIFGAAGCVELSIGDIESLYSEGRRLASAVGRGNGRNRLKRELADAVNSLGGGWMDGCRSIIVCIFAGRDVDNPLMLDELEPLRKFVNGLPETVSENVKWGIVFDDSLCDSVEIAIVVG